MSTKILSLIDTITNLSQIYLSAKSNVEQLESATKRTINNILIFIVFGAAIVFCLLLSIFTLLFFLLITLNLSTIQISGIIVGINVALMLIIIWYFFKVTKQVKMVKNKGFLFILSHFILAAKDGFNKD